MAQPGDSKIKDHFNTDPTTITTQPETAPKTTTKATTSTTATTTSRTKPTTTQITNFFQIKDMNKNNKNKNKFNNSNKNNVCNAHPPRKGMEVEVVTEDKMEIRQGIG